MRQSARSTVESRAAKRVRWAALLLAPVVAVTPSATVAQIAPQILPPTREEVTRPDTPQLRQLGPRLEVESAIERAPCALDAAEFEAIRFTLRDVQFEGLQGLSKADLAPSYAPMIGSEQRISAVCEIRDRAAAILRDAGFIAAVEVPEQRIADGVVRFRVLMARMTQVRVRGDATGAERIIAGYLGELTKRPVFNRDDAERYLLLASDLPGYDVRLTLRPAGGAPGDVVGDVTVQRTPFYADANVQNGGSREIGRWGGLVRSQLFGLTGLADRTTLSAFATPDLVEQKSVQLGHDFRVGAHGLAASGMVTYAWADPSIASASDIEARTLLATADVSYPFVRSLGLTLRGSLGMDFINQDVDFDGVEVTSDRLRVAFARLAYDSISRDFGAGRSLAEPKWRLSGQAEARKGLDIFGATEGCGPAGAGCLGEGEVSPSRIEGRSTATVLRGNLLGEYRPMPGFTLALAVRGQYARKPLLSFEEFAAGNYTVGRGYDPGALIGDRGLGTQAELRVGSLIPKSARRAAVEAYGFFDHARVGNRDQLLVFDGSNRLSSLGGGARIAYDRFFLDVALAVPLTGIGPFDEQPDPRLLISLTSRLWPWSLQ